MFGLFFFFFCLAVFRGLTYNRVDLRSSKYGTLVSSTKRVKLYIMPLEFFRQLNMHISEGAQGGECPFAGALENTRA